MKLALVFLWIGAAFAQQTETGYHLANEAPKAAAVNAGQLPEPEFNDVFFAVGSDKLIPLERQTAAIKAGASGFIVMKMGSASEFKGAKSPVRFPSGEMTFAVRIMAFMGNSDPNSTYVLRKLEEKKSTRKLVMMSGHVSPLGGSVATNLNQRDALPIEFTRYGNSSLKVKTAVLSPGEYAISKVYGQTVFCFGVD